MSTNEKNRFSTLLEELISISGVKNSGLAKALQYDASYISKWVSGRLLPTEKTKKKILSGLSHEIVNQSTSEGLENLYANYQVSFPEELENVIYDNLEIEYDYVTDLQNTCGSLIAPDVSFFASLSPAQYITKMQHPVLRRVKMLDIMAEMDLLKLNHEYRLQIMQGDVHRKLLHIYSDVHFSLVIDLSLNKIDDIYDSIFIMNMLSAMSQVDFYLYQNQQASGRMIFTVKNDFMISALLVNPDRCMSVTISSNDELFFDEDHLCYLHSMTQRTLAESEIDLFIYCQALSDLVVDGNLDFYDQKVHLTLSQRKKYFNHLLHVFETNSNLTFKLAKEPMILDFKYQTNQCIFLSDQFSYIRLNTYNWANNLAIINHPNLKHMFDRFFNAVWNDATSELLSDYSEIHSFFVHIIQQINILSEI